MKTYKVIAKVSTDKFVKYHSHDLISFVKFLDEKYKDWRYANVFKDGVQIDSFTKSKRPTTKQP